MGLSVRVFYQPLAGLGIESGAIWLAYRLKRQRQNHCVSDERFKIHVVIVNLVIGGFITRVREKFLKLDLDTLLDVDEASAAHTGGDSFHLGGDENALMDGLETNAFVDRGPCPDGDEALTELLGCVDHDVVLAHLPRAPHEVADIDRERQLLVFTHTPDSIVRKRPDLRAR